MGREFGLQEPIGLIFEKNKLLRHPGRTRQIERIHGEAGSRTILAPPQ
jgi:hypothetical protein